MMRRNADVPSGSCWSVTHPALSYLADQGVLPSPPGFGADERWVGAASDSAGDSAPLGSDDPVSPGSVHGFQRQLRTPHKDLPCSGSPNGGSLNCLAALEGGGAGRGVCVECLSALELLSGCVLGAGAQTLGNSLFHAGLSCTSPGCGTPSGRPPLKAWTFVFSVSFKPCFACARHC